MIGDLQLGLQVEPGPLEALVCTRYSSHLGPVKRTDRWLRLTAGRSRQGGSAGARVDGDTVYLYHTSFTATLRADGRGTATVEPTPGAVDLLLSSVAAVDGPRHGTLLLSAAAVSSASGSHLFLGEHKDVHPLVLKASSSRAPVIGEACVAAACTRGFWELHSTPFADMKIDRRCFLRAVWLVAGDNKLVSPLTGAEAAGSILEAVLRPAPSVHAMEAFRIVTRIAEAVPAGCVSAAELLGAANPWLQMDQLASALDVRRGLKASAPEMRSRPLRSSLDPMPASRKVRKGS